MGETTSKEKATAKKTSFFKGLKVEFSKIIWPDKETVGKQTVAVVVCSVALGLIIALLDLIIKFGLSFIL
jgi:preprotein translocase subunit SecE